MAFWSRLGVSGTAAAAGAAVAALLAVGGYVAFSSLPKAQAPDVNEEEVAVATPSAPAVQPAPAQPDPPATEALQAGDAAVEVPVDAAAPVEKGAAAPQVQDTAQADAPETERQTEIAQEPQAEIVAPAADALPEPPRPAFDVVQVQPDGGGVIAGRAVPGRPVIFYLDGAEFAQALADAAGKFGLVLDFPPSDAPRSLSMASVLEDGRSWPSEGTLLISPVRSPKPQPDPGSQSDPEAAPEPASEPEMLAEVETDAPVQTGQAAEADSTATAETEPGADAPAVVLATNENIKVIQPAPRPAAPQADDAPVAANVVIDTITYDDSGDVALAGRGAPQGFVRVYLNDKPIKTSQISEDGSWQAPLPDVDAGVYRLRVDEVDTSGAVTSRVETPFQREEPDVVALSDTGPQAVTVQPGFTLWAIAKDKFGAGEQYVRVYEANRDLIRDPDLIYPGQVFAIPEG